MDDKNMKILSPYSPVADFTESPALLDSASLSSFESGWDDFEWAMEVLSAHFGIVVRDLDRFAASSHDPDRLAWLDEAVAALASLEVYVDPVGEWELGIVPSQLDELAGLLLEESDWLLEQSEHVADCFGDFRLATRPRGLSAACFEAVRCAPSSSSFAYHPELFTTTATIHEEDEDHTPRAA